jgi:hypothetical protein
VRVRWSSQFSDQSDLNVEVPGAVLLCRQSFLILGTRDGLGWGVFFLSSFQIWARSGVQTKCNRVTETVENG